MFSDDDFDDFNVNDLIYELASQNHEEMSYYDFKGDIQRKFPNMRYDGDEIGDFYREYKRQRQNVCQRATQFLKDLIDEDKTGVPKDTLGKLFQLTSFRDRRNLVNENEIWNHYLRHKEKKEGTLIKLKPPKTQEPPKPDLTQVKASIYDNLVRSVVEFGHDVPQGRPMNENEFLNYLLNEHPNYTTEWHKLYTQYKKDYKRFHKHDPVMPAVSPDMTLSYPFRSKRKEYEINRSKGIFPETVQMTNEIPDKNSKQLKKNYSRPSFAPFPYSWEIDHLQYDSTRITYLFCLNINTRYLYVIPVNNKSAQETRKALDTLIEKEKQNFNHPVNNIRGDGDKGFGEAMKYFPNINFYFTSSKYTYHNKLVDAVMRTLRNALNDDSLWDGYHDDIIQQLVYYYNFTKHRVTGMKPIDMHTDIEKEWEYIRKMTEELNDVKRKQIANGFHNYKPGDKLKVHLEYAKTSDRFKKRRRQFDVEAEFIGYVNGNCRCKLKSGVLIGDKRVYIVDVPIYYTFKI